MSKSHITIGVNFTGRGVISPWTSLNVVNAGKKKSAEIDIEGVIGWEDWWTDEKKTTTKEQMKAELKAIANLDVDEITVKINSYGGDVNHGVSMYDLLAEHKAKVITRTHGHSASAATIIAQAGDIREMSSTGLYLVHQAQTFAMGTADDMAAGKKSLDTINDQIASIYAKRSGTEKAQAREVMDRNNGLGEWITADEALELGFIDEIYEPMAATASAAPPSKDMLDVWNLPSLPPTPKAGTAPNNPERKKEPAVMSKWLKKLFNFSDEQSAEFDKIMKETETVATELQTVTAELTKVKADMEGTIAERDGTIVTLNANVAEMSEKIEAAVASVEKFANAEQQIVEFSAKVAELETTNKDQSEKLGKMTAGIKPPDQADSAAFTGNKVVDAIKAKVTETGKSYEACAQIVLKENPELYATVYQPGAKK